MIIFETSCSNGANSQSHRYPDLYINDFEPVEVADGLRVTSMGTYSGLFLEDGSDDVVSPVMMIILENVSDKDLQLARISAEYTEFTASFEATDIPAGESVVLLEKNRRALPSGDYSELVADNVAFFNDQMSLMEETFSVSYGEGYVELKNISNEEINGTTYVYYKNISSDMLYGGITYRAKYEGTIPKGGSVKVLTKHFTEKNTVITQIVNVK